MGIIDRIMKPYERNYNIDECRNYFLHFIDAYRFAENNYPETLNSIARRLYAVYFVAFYHIIPDRPFAKGEIGMQVVDALVYASKFSQLLKRNFQVAFLLVGPAQFYGFSTELIMRSQRVSPGKAYQLRMFKD